MTYFLSLVLIATVLTGYSAWNLLKSRFFDVTDFAVLSTFYYAAPLAVCGYFGFNYRGLVFLHAQAADAGLAVESMQYILLAIVCLYGGRALSRLLPNPNFIFSFGIGQSSRGRALLWFAALFVVFASGVLLFGIKEFLAGYATESFGATAEIGNALVYASIELIGLTVMLTLLIGLNSGKTPMKSWIAVSLGIMLFVLLVRAKRLEVLSALLPAVVVLLGSRPSLGRVRTKVFVGAAILLALVSVSALRVSDSLDRTSVVFYAMTEGLYAGHALPGIEARLDSGLLSFEHGARFLNAAIGFIPHFLWPEKDAMIYEGNLALSGVAPLGASTFLSETVLQGGIVAVIIVFGIMGFIFDRLFKFAEVWDDSIKYGVVPIRFGLYLIALVIFVPHFRDGIIPAIKISLQALAFFIVLVGFRYQTAVRPVKNGRLRVSVA